MDLNQIRVAQASHKAAWFAERQEQKVALTIEMKCHLCCFSRLGNRKRSSKLEQFDLFQFDSQFLSSRFSILNATSRECMQICLPFACLEPISLAPERRVRTGSEHPHCALLGAAEFAPDHPHAHSIVGPTESEFPPN